MKREKSKTTGSGGRGCMAVTAILLADMVRMFGG